jgi:hypothetical protein
LSSDSICKRVVKKLDLDFEGAASPTHLECKARQ